MPKPIIGYRNLTSSDVTFTDIADSLCASSSTKTLSFKNDFDKIISSDELYSSIENDNSLLVVDGVVLTKSQSISLLNLYRTYNTAIVAGSDISLLNNDLGFEVPAQLDARDTNNRDRANHTGTQLSSTISDFQSAVSSNPSISGPVTVHNDVTDAGSGEIITSTERTNLSNQSGINTGDETDASIKSKYENNSNTNAFTDAEKSKLSGLESSKFLGEFTSLAALQAAFPTAQVGNYAYVDTGVGQDVQSYIWDTTDSVFVLQLGASTQETPASIKTKYELNPDTNPFTDAEQLNLSNQSGNNTGDETTATIQGKRPIKTVGGITLEGSGNIPFPTTNDVQSVTGDGVNNTDPQNPVLAFPNADEVDDASTNNKFVTQAEKDAITTNLNDIQTLQNTSMLKSVYDPNDNGIVDKAQNVIYKAELNQSVVKGNLLYGVARNPVTGNPIVGLADNTVSFADKTVGMALQAGNSGAIIEVVKIGVIEDIDTSLFAVGETIYLSTSGSFDQKSNILTGVFNPVGFVVKSGVIDGAIIIDTTATESIDTDNTINQSSVTGRTVTDALNDLSSSVTQNATDINDAEIIITQNTNNVSVNASDISNNRQEILNNDNDISALQSGKVDSVTGSGVNNTDPNNPIINLPLYRSAQAGITRVGQTTVALANQQNNVYEEYFNDSFTPSVTDNFQVSIRWKWSSNVTQNSAFFRVTLSDGVNPDIVILTVIEPKDAGGTGEVVDILQGGAIVGSVNSGSSERFTGYEIADIILTAGTSYNLKLEWTKDSNNSRLTIYSSTIRWEQKTQNP